MRPRLCTPLTLTCLLTPLVPGSLFAQNWGEIAIISETLGVSSSRICIGEATRGDIGCPTYAPTVSPTGTLNVTSGMAANRISLTTTGTTWGYLASGASYIPNLSSNNISATNINAAGTIQAISLTVGGQTIQQLAGSGGAGGRISGEIQAFDLVTCPTGWSEYTPARGRFLRGIDSTGTIDPAGIRTVGSIQNDMVGPHVHPQANSWTASGSNFGFSVVSGRQDANDSMRTNVGTETRPKNVAVLFCRKD